MHHKGHIIVFGSKGKLGKEVVRLFIEKGYSVASYSHSEAPIHKDIVKTIICGMLNPLQTDGADLVVNCAAYTNVDDSESPMGKIDAYLSNTIGPANLAIACALANIPLVHISTDYVFGDNHYWKGAYDEGDRTCPLSVYGESKLLGEKNVQKICPQHWIFRTSGLFGREGEGFPQRIIKKVTSESMIRLDSETKYCPTWAPELARVILEAFEKKIPFGLYHACGIVTSPYEFTKEIIYSWQVKQHDQSKLDLGSYYAISAEEANIGRAAKRPIYSVMSCEKLKKVGVEPPNKREYT